MMTKGTIVSGIGEGRHYMALEGYIEQFKEKIGFEPFPGTLNIELDEREMLKFRSSKKMKGIKIDGFENSGKRFGKVNCFKGKINGRDIFIILPEKSHHSNILEVISPINLRKEMNLKDGEKAEIGICR
jgi:riboflavin kinase